jgi:glutamine amidotransferase
LVRHRLRAGKDAADALTGVVEDVLAVAPGSRLNLLLTDGATIWATAWDHALSVRVAPGVALVASEPTDSDPGWTGVADRTLVVARPGDRHLTPLGSP